MATTTQVRTIIGLFVAVLVGTLLWCLWTGNQKDIRIVGLETENSTITEENVKLAAALENTAIEILNLTEELEAVTALEVATAEEDVPVSIIHHVVKCDTLWDLSKKYYGDPLYFPTIAKANGIEGPGYVIYKGTDLVIPTKKGDKFVGSLPQVTRKVKKPVAVEEIVAPVVVPVVEPVAPVVEEVTESVAPVVEEIIEEVAPVVVPVAPVVEEVAPVVDVAPIVTPDLEYPATLPGNTWLVFGNLSPIEKGNLLLYGHVEQGVTMWRNGKNSLVPFVSFDTSLDSEGYDWNNKAVFMAGMKYIRGIPRGVIQIGGGWSHEERYKSSFSASQMVGFGSYWFGWDPITADGCNTCLLFPGNSWGLTGNISPAEGNNLLTSVYAQQGVRAAKIGRVSVIPYAEATVGVDTDKHFWNNRRILGGGLKLGVPFGGSVLNAGVVYRDERRWLNDQRGSGWTAFVDIWSGWNPSVVAPERSQ